MKKKKMELMLYKIDRKNLCTISYYYYHFLVVYFLDIIELLFLREKTIRLEDAALFS